MELVKTTLTAMMVFLMMAFDLLSKTIVAPEKICRRFLWHGKKEANGGHCRVAWKKVCCPTSV